MDNDSNTVLVSFRCPVNIAAALEQEAKRNFSSVSAVARLAAYKAMLERGLIEESQNV